MNKDTLGTAEAPVQSEQDSRVQTVALQNILAVAGMVADQEASLCKDMRDFDPDTLKAHIALFDNPAELVRRANAYDALKAKVERLTFMLAKGNDPKQGATGLWANEVTDARDLLATLPPVLSQEVQK